MRASLLALALFAAPLVAADAPAKFGRLPAGSVVENFTVVGADGKDLKLSDFKGKAIVLNFWATNRGPGDALQGAYLKYQELGVVVLAICSGATRADFDKWVEKTKDSVAY